MHFSIQKHRASLNPHNPKLCNVAKYVYLNSENDRYSDSDLNWINELMI